MAWFALFTVKLRVTGGAARWFESPSWSAWIEHVPPVRIVIVVPLVPVEVQTLPVAELNVTVLPEPPPVAETTKGASPKVLSASVPKLIACGALRTVNVRVTCGAGS
jgi:hypothetical protein